MWHQENGQSPPWSSSQPIREESWYSHTPASSFPSSFSEVPNMIEPQLPTMITCFIMLLSSTPLLSICLFPTSVPVYPGFNFKINYLNSSPCFRVLLGKFNLKQVVKFTGTFALRSIPYTLSVQPCISGNYISWAPLPVDIQLVWSLGASGKRTRAGREKS